MPNDINEADLPRPELRWSICPDCRCGYDALTNQSQSHHDLLRKAPWLFANTSSVKNMVGAIQAIDSVQKLEEVLGQLRRDFGFNLADDAFGYVAKANGLCKRIWRKFALSLETVSERNPGLFPNVLDQRRLLLEEVE